MKELIAVVGWFVGVQGLLGLAGRVFGEGPWGLLQKRWEVPTAGYAVLTVVGAGLAVYGERAKLRARAAARA
ncbi:hypothetical protein I3F58_17755 [Streptomyces sp. MUM 203J]|uniref:hypothetical protein n=1 Tax=Streptomyces sp. MUM 203J TaxID=2791990 RepID=UPI001F04B404|nr:hypothetical protein [Streptomyces sp. MUM 203J]MCH0541372.1 hypothetical protein [Streptomyces sp. MUM 203J]